MVLLAGSGLHEDSVLVLGYGAHEAMVMNLPVVLFYLAFEVEAHALSSLYKLSALQTFLDIDHALEPMVMVYIP